MTEREAALPKPFGYVRDDNGAAMVFQHKPFTEIEGICYSTAPVYSHAQMVELWQASRQQALEEAMEACNERAAGYDILANTQAVIGCDDCLVAIRSLTSPTGDKA